MCLLDFGVFLFVVAQVKKLTVPHTFPFNAPSTIEPELFLSTLP